MNEVANDSLYSYQHRVKTRFTGIAPMFGLRKPLSKNKRLVFQLNVGAGVKYRFVRRENIPEGYKLHVRFSRAKEWLSPEYNGSPVNVIHISGYSIYLPAAIRFTYFF